VNEQKTKKQKKQERKTVIKAENAIEPKVKQKDAKAKVPEPAKPKKECSKVENPVDDLHHFPSDSEYDDNNYLQVFLQMLIDEAGLCRQQRTVKRSTITELLAKNHFPITYNELVNEMWSFGLIDNAKKRSIVFSENLFGMPNLRFPAYKAPTSVELEASDEEECKETLVLRIQHILTLSRLVNKNFSWSSKACIVCQKSYLAEMQLEEHLRKIHGDEFQIPDHISKGNTTTQMFELYQMGRRQKKEADKVRFAIRNNYFLTLTLRKILYVCSSKFVAATWPYYRSLRVNSGEVFEFSLNRELFASTNDNHSILVVFEEDIEYVEHYHVKVSWIALHFNFLKRTKDLQH
jgi:hypothetical protein